MEERRHAADRCGNRRTLREGGGFGDPKKNQSKDVSGKELPGDRMGRPTPKFKPIDSIQKEDWDVDRKEQEGFEEFAQFEESGTMRCGQCKHWTTALVRRDGELEDGGYCLKNEEQAPFYTQACSKFEEKDDPSSDIPF